MSDERTNLLLNPETSVSEKETKDNNVPEVPKEAYLYDAFYEGDINDLDCDDKPELITLMGLSSSGKTTFVGSLYALLRRRPDLLGVTFLDSDTLTGFEKKVYLRRIKGDSKSAVKRTLRSDGSILNIVIADENEQSRMILISDKAGESYGDVLDSSEEAKKHIAVKYANKLVLFLDSEEIINRYSSYKDKLLTLLTAFNEAGMLPEEKKVITVFNKIDMLESNTVIAKEEWNKREAALLRIVNGFFNAGNRVYRINSLGIKYGDEHQELIDLFKSLLSSTEQKSLPNEYNWIKKLTRSTK